VRQGCRCLSSRLFQAWRTAARGDRCGFSEGVYHAAIAARSGRWAAGATGRGVSSSNSSRSPADRPSPTRGGAGAERLIIGALTGHRCVGQRHGYQHGLMVRRRQRCPRQLRVQPARADQRQHQGARKAKRVERRRAPPRCYHCHRARLAGHGFFAPAAIPTPQSLSAGGLAETRLKRGCRPFRRPVMLLIQE
jgi:hypothetical protein